MEIYWFFLGECWYVVGGFSPTRLKNMIVKLDHFCRDRGENKKYVKPPPSLFLAETWFLPWKKSCTTGDKLPINWLAGFLPSTVSQLLHLEFSQPCKTQNQTLFLLRPDDSSLGPHQCGQVHRRVHHIWRMLTLSNSWPLACYSNSHMKFHSNRFHKWWRGSDECFQMCPHNIFNTNPDCHTSFWNKSLSMHFICFHNPPTHFKFAVPGFAPVSQPHPTNHAQFPQFQLWVRPDVGDPHRSRWFFQLSHLTETHELVHQLPRDGTRHGNGETFHLGKWQETTWEENQGEFKEKIYIYKRAG